MRKMIFFAVMMAIAPTCAASNLYNEPETVASENTFAFFAIKKGPNHFEPFSFAYFTYSVVVSSSVSIIVAPVPSVSGFGIISGNAPTACLRFSLFTNLIER